MKIKMWCLINKNTNKPIQIWINGIYVIGFSSKKGLMSAIENLEYDEEIRKIEFEI
jgi:hypothetical protein